jgi:hypothetical protein
LSAIVLGMVLTFADVDGRHLQLTVVLSETATASLRFGGRTLTSTPASMRHRFVGLPAPESEPLGYLLRAGSSSVAAQIRPIPREGPLKIALYGDSRDGTAPHRLLLQAIEAAGPDLVIHTGDVVNTALDDSGWVEHLRATAPLGAEVPVVLALGNHELYVPPELRQQVRGIDVVLGLIPPPDDPLVREHGAPPGTFHLRVGPALIISLDSNAPLGPGSAQRRFLEAALEDRRGAKQVLVTMHQGPLSAGRHGPHPEGEGLPELFSRHQVTAVLTGHDHTYQRIVEGGVSYVVSGGGGAPLYAMGHYQPGLLRFVSNYHWAQIELGQGATIEAFGLEGSQIDRGDLVATGAPPELRVGWVLAAVGLSLVGALLFLARLVSPSRRLL